jgi:hypothetical protein
VRLLDRLSRCPFHDRPPTPLRIAGLEVATGINLAAVAELWASSADIPDHYDGDLIDCGRSRCRKRRDRE